MNHALNHFGKRPKIQPIEVEPYLQHLGLEKEEPSLKYLNKLHRNHLLSIPFENLDIHYRKKIVLDYQKIYEKIIGNRRGGFCYELNGLFLHLLANLGFDVQAGSARVFENGHPSAEFDHMIVFCQLGSDRYLCDVGFGELFSHPKKLELNQTTLDYNHYWKFEMNPDEDWILKKSSDNSAFNAIYQFHLQPHEIIEFLPRCNYHQESPDSHFTQQKMITQLFAEGRITLTNRKLKTQLFGEIVEKPILNEDEFLTQLEEYFGINSQALLRQQFD